LTHVDPAYGSRVPKMTSQIVGLQPIAIPKRCHLDDGKAEMTSAQTLRDLLCFKMAPQKQCIEGLKP
jgi:hypothetical protein